MPDTITYDDLNYFQGLNHNCSNYSKDTVSAQTNVSGINLFRIKQISQIARQDRIPTEYFLCGLPGRTVKFAPIRLHPSTKKR